MRMKIRGRKEQVPRRTTSVFLHSIGRCDVPLRDVAYNAMRAYNKMYQINNLNAIR